MTCKRILIFYITSSFLCAAHCLEAEREEIVMRIAAQYIAQNELFNKQYDAIRLESEVKDIEKEVIDND